MDYTYSPRHTNTVNYDWGLLCVGTARYSNHTISSNIEGVLSGLGTGVEMFVMIAFVIFLKGCGVDT